MLFFIGHEEEDVEGDQGADEKTLKEIQRARMESKEGKEEQSSFRIDAAKRTLMRIRNKLQGFDDQSLSSLSVEGFVRLLITEAQDYKNLCKVFPGWAPW